MAGSRGREDSVLADQDLLNTICSTNLGNDLNDLGVVETAVTANDQEGAINAFGYGEQDSCDKSLAVMRLLEDGDLLSKTGSVL